MPKLTPFLCVVAAFVLSGCNLPRNDTNTSNSPKITPLGALLDSLYQEQPGVMNNEVTRSIFADSIKARFQRYRGASLPYLSGIPLEYEMCIEYPPRLFDAEMEFEKNAGKFVVKFSHTESGKDNHLTENGVTTFQVFTIMTKEEVAGLVDNAEYYVNGTFRDFANNSQETGFVLPNGRCLTDYPGVAKSAFDEPFVNIGTLILDNVTITKAE